MGEKENNIDCIKILGEHTTLIQYLEQLKKNVFFDEFYYQYKENINLKDSDEQSPFLTVLIRTQGKREEGLRESLLCLAAQSNTNFEILLIAHKAGKNKKIIEEILEDQQDEIRKKLRYVELDEGTRTTPLNVGFSLAKGQYVAVFDDDDILFEDWVESFEECAKENKGKILHSYAFSQNWKNIEKMGYRAESKPVGNYCQKFELLTQLVINKCPLMTLAFPTYIFQQLGVTFNEKLHVMEDWEYFMRVAGICGVADISSPTAIYRSWQNIETSATLHDQEAWNNTYQKIQKSFSERGLLIPASHVDQLISLLNGENKRNIVAESNDKSTLYYSKGAAFNDQLKLTASNETKYPEFDLWFIFEEKSNQIKALRFDLCEEGLFILKDIHIDVWFTNGEKREVSIEECAHTGINYANNLLFLHEDPEIVWELNDTRNLDVVHVYGSISRSIPRKSLKLRLFEHIFSIKYWRKKREMHNKGLF